MPGPEFPIGPFRPVPPEPRASLIDVIAAAPAQLAAAVERLPDDRLDQPYRNWTARQIVHHLADSHMHSVIRFKWALTEERPTIKAYDERAWVALADSRDGEVADSLALLTALHARWTTLLRSMTEAQFERTFDHPESGETVRLADALAYYAWHGRHHTAQIEWLAARPA